MSRTTLHLCRWLITACLMVCLPLQAISASVAGLLGARHSHVPASVEIAPIDPMAGWMDFRRVQHDHLVEPGARPPTHAQMHAHGSRHHHEATDASVQKEEPAGLSDNPSVDGAQASAAFIFLAAPANARLPAASESFGAAWQSAASRRPGVPMPWRIERPPQAASRAVAV